jgi:anti-sigma regulatory factor (Ser/Thr protein kinase)
VADPTQEANMLKNSGRGVYLIRKLMDKVEYNGPGNKVTMTKKLG